MVRFGRIAFENVRVLLDNLLRNYELYSAANAEGADLFSDISARNFSDAFGDSSHLRIAFYSDVPPLFRPSFKFTRLDTPSFDAELIFDLCDFPDPPPVKALLVSLQEFTTILRSEDYAIYYEISDEWRAGDFSATTLIYRSQ